MLSVGYMTLQTLEPVEPGSAQDRTLRNSASVSQTKKMEICGLD